MEFRIASNIGKKCNLDIKYVENLPKYNESYTWERSVKF